jgi:hypothetical protein
MENLKYDKEITALLVIDPYMWPEKINGLAR